MKEPRISKPRLLTTASGKTFEIKFFATTASKLILFIVIANSNLQEITKVFSDPAETIKLSSNNTVLEGYTKFLSVFMNTDSTIRIGLSKGE